MKITPAACFDLDGTIRYSANGIYIETPEDIRLYPEVDQKLWELRKAGYLLFGISNQGGVAYGKKSEQDVANELIRTFELFPNGNPFHIVKTCYHMEGGTHEPYNIRSLMRKPYYGMLVLCEQEAIMKGWALDWNNSFFVGDRDEDRQCAEAAGIKFYEANEYFGRRYSSIDPLIFEARKKLNNA